MNFLKLAAALLFCAAVANGVARAQGVGASGTVSGIVSDQSGAVVQKAAVTATDTERGIRHTATTDTNGQYQLTGLPPATYNVSAEFTGFQTAIQKSVTLTVGQFLQLDFHLRVAAAAQETEVTAEPPAVETERASQADTINQQYIADLPIDRRDYLTFTLLSPGVSDANHLSADQNFKVKQTPQTGLSFYGSNGRGNSITIDGGEANDDGGGVRTTLSQDAVQEFQINRSNYSADLGSASGASINIVSKSGTNNLHGSLYGFFRNDAMDARNPFAYSQALAPNQVFNPASADTLGKPIKDSLNRQQFGGTLGFPIQKDKTFLFVAFEGLRSDAQNSVPLLLNTSVLRPQSLAANNQTAILNGLTAEGATPVPCLTGQPALPASTCAGILQNTLTVNPASSPLSAYLISQFENNGGVFPYTTREYLASGRLDHIFNNNNQGFLRYNFGHDQEENPDVQALTGFSRGTAIHSFDDTVEASWFHQFSPLTQNEVRLQYDYNNFDVVSNFPAQTGIDMAGFGYLGDNIFLPSYTILRRYEMADNLTLIRGHHTFKAGAYELIRGNLTSSNTFFPGRFVFGPLPGGILSPCLQVPAACGLAGTTGQAVLDSLQSALLGLPQFYQQGFGNPTYGFTRPFTAFYFQDSWQIRPNLTFTYGARYELDTQTGPLSTDPNNIAPRVSFAWDPWNNHKTVVRGGFGIFYSPIYAQIDNVVETLGNVNGNRQIANLLVPLTGAPGNPSLTSAAIFQTLFAQGLIQCTKAAAGQPACITPANLTQFGITVTHTGALPPLTVLFAGAPNYQNPYSEQAEFGIEHELAPGFTVSVSGIYVHTLKLPVALDTNNLSTTPMTTVALANGKSVSYRNWGAPQCSSTPTVCFANPLVLQNNVYSSAASAVYEAGIIEVKKRFSSYFSFMANYTFSKAFDDSTDYNSDFSPQDETNLAAERALSNFDERHKIVVAGVFDSPFHRAVLSGFEFSPIVSYHSGLPFNLLTINDTNSDRHYVNDRPIGAARNTGLGPNFVDTDARLAWHCKVGEKATVQVTAEAFNLLNRTNYQSINNIVPANLGLPLAAGGLGFTTFNLHGTAPVTPANQQQGLLQFTSAFPKREVQLGLRLSF